MRQVTDASLPLGCFSALVVGRRYYVASASAGEEVRIRRVPQNPHDSNAIAVCTAGGSQLGHLPRWLAQVLAPCMDKLGCELQGTVTSAGSTYAMPITASICALPGTAPRLREMLAAYWAMWQLVDPTPAFGHDDDDNYSIASTDSGSSSSSSVTGIYDSGSGILVISTTEGFCDWIRQLAGPAAQPGIRWVVYSRLLPIESVVHSQAVLVCAPDAMHLLARLDVEHWASVAVDRTAIGSDVLSGMADLAATLKDVPTQYV